MLRKTGRGQKARREEKLTERVVRESGLEVRVLNPNSTGYETEKAWADGHMICIGENRYRTAARHELTRRKQKGVRGRNELIRIVMQKAENGDEFPGTGRYTRKSKGLRKAIAQKGRERIENAALKDMHRLVDRARGLGETRYIPTGY